MKKMKIYQSDILYIFNNLSKQEKESFNNATILITGCAGFLGFYITSFFASFANELKIKKIIGIDNFLLGTPNWLNELNKDSDKLEIHNFDITNFSKLETKKIMDANYIIHMASIASPTFYRKYPLETIDANVTGLRNLLDYFKDKDVRGLLFFSSSEVYGDPLPEFIPTTEEYRGNVSMIGPRACYDEAKRFGETLCYLYAEKFGLPISIVRPFNNYGPGMKLNDKRVPADFAKAVIENKPLLIHSDGNPTRTFCYVTDAVVGYVKALVYKPFDYFNIGIEEPEIDITTLANIYKQAGSILFQYQQPIEFKRSEDQNYLKDNPSRRCPNITKAKKLLNYQPQIYVKDGVFRFLTFLTEEGEGMR